MQTATNKGSLKITISELLRDYKKGGKAAKGKGSKKTHKAAVSAAFDIMKKGK